METSWPLMASPGSTIGKFTTKNSWTLPQWTLPNSVLGARIATAEAHTKFLGIMQEGEPGLEKGRRWHMHLISQIQTELEVGAVNEFLTEETKTKGLESKSERRKGRKRRVVQVEWSKLYPGSD